MPLSLVISSHLPIEWENTNFVGEIPAVPQKLVPEYQAMSGESSGVGQFSPLVASLLVSPVPICTMV